MNRGEAMRRLVALIAAALGVGCGVGEEGGPEVVVASKAFTESVLLGEIASALAEDAGARPAHRRALGGSRLVWDALVAGEVDLYPDYTGTLAEEIFGGRVATGRAALDEELARHGARLGPSLGFENTYALGLLPGRAAALGVRSMSDLRAHEDLVLGFSHEFMDRREGWPGVSAAYGLQHENVRGLDHDLAYRALAAGEIDVTDVYTTDAEIARLGLVVLEDDLGHFPDYDAVWVYRADLERRAPELVAALARLAGRTAEPAMAAMNARVRLDGESEAAVARAHLATLGVRAAPAPRRGRIARVARRTAEHLALTGVSLAAAIVLALPAGVFAARRPAAGRVVLAVTGVVQTIPSLALLVVLVPLLGIGAPPAIAALFLYSLLPIVRNTHAGLGAVPAPVRESAIVLGLGPGERLRAVELPLAAGAILAGIKTAAVINVGTATLGALVGAGGYGQPILSGIRLDDTGLILEGALPAALLALAVQGAFDVLERMIVPLPLRRRDRAGA